MAQEPSAASSLHLLISREAPIEPSLAHRLSLQASCWPPQEAALGEGVTVSGYTDGLGSKGVQCDGIVLLQTPACSSALRGALCCWCPVVSLSIALYSQEGWSLPYRAEDLIFTSTGTLKVAISGSPLPTLRRLSVLGMCPGSRLKGYLHTLNEEQRLPECYLWRQS